MVFIYPSHMACDHHASVLIHMSQLENNACNNTIVAKEITHAYIYGMLGCTLSLLPVSVHVHVCGGRALTSSRVYSVFFPIQ